MSKGQPARNSDWRSGRKNDVCPPANPVGIHVGTAAVMLTGDAHHTPRRVRKLSGALRKRPTRM